MWWAGSFNLNTTNIMMIKIKTNLVFVAKPALCRPLQDTSVSRMSAGNQLHRRLLGVLSARLSGLSDLEVDLRELQMHINKVREAGLPARRRRVPISCAC